MSRTLWTLVAAASALCWSCSPPGGEDPDGGPDPSGWCADRGVSDRDGDGIPDLEEGAGATDTDGDGQPDSQDPDSDGDGRRDAVESGMVDCEGSPRDSDGDGAPDFQDRDSDDNGYLDSEEDDEDLDDDGEPNWRDLDDDGDDIPDDVEIGPDPADPADSDMDGVPDYHSEDSDGDGILDRHEGADDLDGDGLGCWRDPDCDGDGFSDQDERGGAPGEPPVDTDHDGAPDFRDRDSDGDGLSDENELVHGTMRTERDTDGDGFSDYDEVQAGTDPLDATDFPEPDPCDPGDCGPVELCGELGNGDGLDNNCNGEVDETCPCTSSETRPCFVGPPSLRGEGACSDGIETCGEFGSWGPCVGGTSPEDETCDGADNDCDGEYDEGLAGCASPLNCPGTRTAAPLSTLELDGRDIYEGAYDSWTWEIFCPPTVPTCPTPEDPTARETSVYIVSSGSYRIRATIVIGGVTYTCQYTIDVQGDGLRVELLWDTQGEGAGDTDVDLHLHRPGTSTAWFHANDDCYYMNCTASAHSSGFGTPPDWGLDDTADVSACGEAPHGHGAEWTTLGYCANPRLDVDVITCDPTVTDPTSGSFCAPENINVDNPELGSTFRVMVNYYSAHSYSGVTHPTVNIYCGGALRATLGGDSVALTGRSTGSSNDCWLVADVEFTRDICGAVDCIVRPIARDDGSPWIQFDTSFGPPW